MSNTETPDVFEQLWDCVRAAEYLNVRPEYVEKKARAREIPGKKVGKYWRFVPHKLKAWAERDEGVWDGGLT